MRIRLILGLSGLVQCLVFSSLGAASSITNSPPTFGPSSEDLVAILIRMLGAFAIVVGVFLVAAWFFKKSRLFATYQGAGAQLKILETRSLGHRNALIVVGYQNRRLLLAASSTGVQFLSPLPDAEDGGLDGTDGGTFAQRLDAAQEEKT